MLLFRCLQLEELVKSGSDRIAQFQEQARSDAVAWQEEKSSMIKELNETKRIADAARENNHKTLLKNRELREKY